MTLEYIVKVGNTCVGPFYGGQTQRSEKEGSAAFQCSLGRKYIKKKEFSPCSTEKKKRHKRLLKRVHAFQGLGLGLRVFPMNPECCQMSQETVCNNILNMKEWRSFLFYLNQCNASLETIDVSPGS